MSELLKLKMYIGGEWVAPLTGDYFESFNPYTGKPWVLVPKGGHEDADSAVQAAKKAFYNPAWHGLTASARGQLLHKLGDLITENAEYLAECEVKDNGKLISEMRLQTSYMAQWFYYFGGLADKIEGSVLPIDKSETFTYTNYEPLGVCVAIVPWNSPLFLTSYKLAPALAAGNTVVIKPSSDSSFSTLELMKLIEKAGFPEGVVNVVTGPGGEVGEALVTHPDVAMIALTGGTDVGRHTYVRAAESLKRVSLELGGKSPNIVFDDCDIDNAVKGVISGIFAATGQTCVAGSRLLVQESIHDEFVAKLVTFAKTAKIGNPMSNETQVGPVTSKAQFNKILSYMQIAEEEGATCVLGGKKATGSECGDGWFVEPSIYTNVRNTMRIAQEEIFGPVLSVIPFKDEEEAIAIANDVVYGLAAGIWTQSIRRAIELPKKLQAGMVWVNMYRAVSYMAPFGGFKQSGLGFENGQEAIFEYMRRKAVWISTSNEVPNPFVLR